MSKLKIGVIQLTSVLDYKSNLSKIQKYIEDAKGEGAKAIFLPECFYSLSDGSKPSPYLVEKDNEHFENVRQLAVRNSVYLIGGTVAYNENGNVLNKALNFDPNGNLLADYDKINLFACDILSKDGTRKQVDEGIIYTSGSTPQIIEVEGFKIGLAICFDLRFSNLLLHYYRENVDLITFPAAFTVPTGRAHWHTLLRARAIEGQCYVVAAGQWGQNHSNVRTYGHSLAVNPWGEVMEDAKDGEGYFVVELSRDELNEFGSRMIINQSKNY